MSDSKTAVFRVDAGTHIGGGHVMRCLSLAGALRNLGWTCIFMIHENGLGTVPALAASEHDIRPLRGSPNGETDEMRALLPPGCDLIIVDHYGRDAQFEAACRPWARHIFVIDDLPARLHDCDGLLDQTMGCTAADYDGCLPPSSRRLMGSDFTLLRQEFQPYADWSRQTPKKASRLLITFGNNDPENQTAKTLRAIDELELDVCVVVGTGNPFVEEITLLAAQQRHTEIIRNPNNMADLMARADVALSASGSTCWELAFMGLPSLLIVCADNQKTIAKRLNAEGIALSLGWHEDVSENMITSAVMAFGDEAEMRTAMSFGGRQLIDGKGAKRAAAIMDRTFSEH